MYHYKTFSYSSIPKDSADLSQKLKQQGHFISNNKKLLFFSNPNMFWHPYAYCDQHNATEAYFCFHYKPVLFAI